MPVTRYSAQFRAREDVFDSITPNNKVQRDVSAPAGDWKPAPWLPIVFSKSNIGAGTDNFVISSGKVVALDRDGKIVPAGLRAALVDTFVSVATVLAYTSDDFDQGVIDLTTGAPVATSSGATYNCQEIALALIERGLVDPVTETTSASAIPTTDTDVAEIIQAFISKPIGVAAYDIYVWSGRPEDGDMVFNNYSKQHLVQFLTELQMRVPHRTTQSDAASAFIGGTVVPVTAQTATGDFPIAGEVWTETALDDVPRWSAVVDGMSVVALALDNRPAATNTSRTPVSCDTAGILVVEKSSLADVSAEGDWYLDADVGVIFISSDTWATVVAATTTITFTYSFYTSSGATGASSDRFIFFDGEGKPGDFVSYDSHSNFCVMGGLDDAGSGTEWIGRLLKMDSEPKGLLDKVKTSFALTGMTAVSQMPGSATSGYSDLITLATSEDIADQIAIINLIVR